MLFYPVQLGGSQGLTAVYENAGVSSQLGLEGAQDALAMVSSFRFFEVK